MTAGRTNLPQLETERYRRLEKAFAPGSAAIVGASTDPAKFGGRALKYCLERGYRGALYPINPGADAVQGIEAYGRVSDIPAAPDIAVIAVPADGVAEALEEVGRKGAGIAIVYGAQFAEIGGEGRRRQDELLAIADRYDMRLIGPNCMGVMSLASGFVASFTTAPEHHDGNGWPDIGSVSVVSQSGAVGIQIFAQLRDRGLGIANWISTGNQADVDVADCIAYFAEDPYTRVIAVYMEDAGRGLKLLQALEMARAAAKPVAILKVGTTPAGGVTAAGHTAALYVEDDVVEDLFAQYGVLRARSVNDLIDLATACHCGPIPASPEVAAISVSGGGAVMISDVAAKSGLVLPDFDPTALARLKETNSFVNDRNPIDVSAPSMSRMDITAGHLEFGLEQGMPTMLGYISHVPIVPRTRGPIMARLRALKPKFPDRHIAIAMNANADDRKELIQGGIAVFEDPVVAAEAVARLVRAGQAFAKQGAWPQPAPTTGDAGRAEALSRLERAGIPMLPETLVASAEEAARARRVSGGRVAMKLQAESLAHKTEIDGIRLGIGGEEEARTAFAELAEIRGAHEAAHPGICIAVSPMVEDGVEFIVGIRDDPHFGPLVLLGLGGPFVELVVDRVFRKAPFGPDEADAMIESLRGRPLLDGWRGGPALNRDALARALVALSELAVDPEAGIAAIEINPLFVCPEGIVGADLVLPVPGKSA